MKRRLLINRMFILLTVILIVSTKICGKIHLIGSMEWPYLQDHGLIKYVARVKIKQDLIKRNGLMWYLAHPVIPTTFLFNEGNECGLFIMESDSTVAFEIKKSIDNFSEANDTFYIVYMQAFAGPNDGRNYNYDRFTVDSAYRDSFFDKITLLGRMFACIGNRGGDKYWFLSDTSLYYSPICFSLFGDRNLFEVINLWSLEREYIEECKVKGYTPIFINPNFTLPDSLRGEDAINHPEIQLLYKYMRKNDSIILASKFTGRQYDLDIEYDHRKTENLKPVFF